MVGVIVIFRPHIMEEENHDLCCVFSPNFARSPWLPTISHYLTILVTCSFMFRFTKEEAELLRYIRIFDVISELYCILLRRRRMFEIIALYPNFWCYIRTILHFTKKEADVRNFCAISDFLTLYPNWTILRYTKEEAEARKRPSYLKAENIPVHSGRLVDLLFCV